jgi:hypothetical protein
MRAVLGRSSCVIEANTSKIRGAQPRQWRGRAGFPRAADGFPPGWRRLSGGLAYPLTNSTADYVVDQVVIIAESSRLVKGEDWRHPGAAAPGIQEKEGARDIFPRAASASLMQAELPQRADYYRLSRARELRAKAARLAARKVYLDIAFFPGMVL